MYSFEHATYFWLLILVPCALLLFVLGNKRVHRYQHAFGSTSQWARLSTNTRKGRLTLKLGLWLSAFVLLVIALSNPQKKAQTIKEPRKSLDVYLAVDISKSMWAEDIRPNRMSRAKQFGRKLVDALRGDRIGLIYVAGAAYLQMPLTVDYNAARLFLDGASPSLASTQGTALAEAIRLVVQSRQKAERTSSCALIFLTDGENHEQGAIELAEQAAAEGVKIFTVGIGDTEGATIPLGRGDVQRDQQGHIVQTALNEEMLSQLARAGGGDYTRLVHDESALSTLRAALDNMERQEQELRQFDVKTSSFYWFLGGALLLLLVDFFIPTGGRLKNL